jgi:hypothetical protein
VKDQFHLVCNFYFVCDRPTYIEALRIHSQSYNLEYLFVFLIQPSISRNRGSCTEQALVFLMILA